MLLVGKLDEWHVLRGAQDGSPLRVERAVVRRLEARAGKQVAAVSLTRVGIGPEVAVLVEARAPHWMPLPPRRRS